MTKENFHRELSRVNALRESRDYCAQLVKNDMSLVSHLIENLFITDDKISCQAAWIMELLCDDYPYAIIPHLDAFTQNIHKVHFESAIRSVSKICQLIAQAYTSKENNAFKRLLSPEHKERIVETCFDWMINKHNVAPKVYAMETLFLFGRENTWILNDLKQILEQDFQTQSAAFKSRAKHVFIRMKKISNA